MEQETPSAKNLKPKTAAADKEGPQPGPVTPKYNMSGSRTMLHHLFRAQLADFLKNRSFKPGNPDITKVPHQHFFHTINSSGRAQRYTAAVGGHFHEVTWEINPRTGELEAKCGPPLKKVAFSGPDGLTQYENVPVEWKDTTGSMGKRGATIIDNHVHVMTYEKTDEISPDKIRATQTANRAAVSDGLDSARQALSAEGISVKE